MLKENVGIGKKNFLHYPFIKHTSVLTKLKYTCNFSKDKHPSNLSKVYEVFNVKTREYLIYLKIYKK